MPVLAIKSGTTAIAGSTVKGSFSYFSGSTKDLGPTNVTGFYSGVDAPEGGYTLYQIGGSGGWTAQVATDRTILNSLLILAGATGSTIDQRITWATNTNSVFINSGATPTYTIGQSALGGVVFYINGGGTTGTSGLVAYNGSFPSLVFGCSGTMVATSSGIGFGQANTNAWTAAGCNAAGGVIDFVNNLDANGYSDWYLPSRDELRAVYTNARFTLGMPLTGGYWGSSVYNPSYNEGVNFETGNLNLIVFKPGSSLTVAIRSF